LKYEYVLGDILCCTYLLLYVSCGVVVALVLGVFDFSQSV